MDIIIWRCRGKNQNILIALLFLYNATAECYHNYECSNTIRNNIIKLKEMSRLEFKKFSSLFVLLFGFWLLLSGLLDWFHLTFGIISTAIVTTFCYDMVFISKEGTNNTTKTIRFFAYLPWILYQIVLANIDVAKRVLDPRMPIQPGYVSFKSYLKSDMSKMVLANSITLTPGTITVDIDGGNTFLIHSIATAPGDDLLEGTMERKVAHVFMEGK